MPTLTWARPAISALAALTFSLSLVTESWHRCPEASRAQESGHHQQGPAKSTPSDACDCLGHCCAASAATPAPPAALAAVDVTTPQATGTDIDAQRLPIPLPDQLPWPNAPPLPISTPV